MERLTKRIDGRLVFPSELIGVMMTPSNDTMFQILTRLAAYEDTGLEPQDIISAVDMAKIACALHELNAYKDIGPIDHIRDILQAEQAGRLVVLPCKVGDVVYGFHQERTILPMVAKWIETDADGWTVAAQYAPMAPKFYLFSDFGKTVFLTREEAEAALAQEGGTNEYSGCL